MSTHKFSLLCKLNKRTFKRLKNQFSFTYFLLTVNHLITEQIEFIIAESYDLEVYEKEFKFVYRKATSIFYTFDNVYDLKVRMKRNLESTTITFNRYDV